MGLFSQSLDKKREKEIRRDIKELSKELVAAGMDKKAVREYLDVFQELLTDACRQKNAYLQSRQKMSECRQLICELLSDFPKNTEAEVRRQLAVLEALLAGICHDCTIREDDMDFTATCSYVRKMVQNYEKDSRLMLQSELENLLHVIEEVLEWEEPDFCALACFCRYGSRSDLAELENHQRNEMIVKFYREQFWNGFERELEACGKEAHMTGWIKEKLQKVD